ncbi:MAG: PKD domain-containing protein, partial [Syntrophobacteria bacterium]
MGNGFAFGYRESHITRFALAILLFVVFISILFCPSVASAVVDVTLAGNASSGADGYRLFYREEGRSYNYGSPDWEGTGTTCIIPGLDESTTYHFVVRAFNDNGESGNSNEEHLYPSGTNQAPTASITASPTSGDAPLSVSFNDSGSNDPDGSIVSYSWNFGDGTSGTGVTAGHTYNNSGNYTVSLTVTDDNGATDSASTVIQVTTAPVPNQAPTASFTATPTSGDAPLPVSFNASASSDPDGTIVSYSWNFGDGTSDTGVTRGHTYNNSGNYTVSL